MPSSVTHAYFAMDVWNHLLPKYQDKIKGKRGYYKLFAQGSDPFMFYHWFVGKKAKMGMETQKKMHTSLTRKFFLTTVKEIYDRKLNQDPEVMSYLYGYICHYFLDLYLHPFIVYQAGEFRIEDKNTYSYQNRHQKIEYRIDSYIIQEKLQEDPKKFKVQPYLFEVEHFSKSLQEVIIRSIGQVYEIQDSVSLYEKSLWWMQKFFRYVNYDPWGIKGILYRGIDQMTPRKIPRLEELSYHTNDDGKKYLNLEKKPWCDPWNQKNVHTTSFEDLYQVALQDAHRAIVEVTNMLETTINENRLKQIFRDLSFATGLPCSQQVKFQYFKKED